MRKEIVSEISEILATDYMLRDFNIMYRINRSRRICPSENYISNIVRKKDSYIHESEGNVCVEMDKLQQLLFPIFENRIFISHFSKNINFARCLQDVIYKNTGSQPFIDSEVWDNIYNIILNTSRDYGFVEEYELDDGRTIHVHDMNEYNNIAKNLFVAFAIILQRAIEQSAAFVFICENQDIVDGRLSDEIRITSPWVAQEIYASSLIPEDERLDESAMTNMSKEASIEFLHKVSVSHLHKVQIPELIDILKQNVQH